MKRSAEHDLSPNNKKTLFSSVANVDSSLNSKDEGDLVNNHGKENVLFSNDVIGLIYSFLPFDQILKDCLQLVCKQWYESLLVGDFRFALIHRVESYLFEEFNLISDSTEIPNRDKNEIITTLLVSVKHWLYARQYTISWLLKNRRRKLYGPWLIKLLSERNSTTYPRIRITKMENLFGRKEELVVLMIYLNEQATLKMSALYSVNEDTVIYVDVLSGKNDFNWKERLNIDPNVKRNLVLYVDAKDFEDADCSVEKYQINEKFFESLYRELKAPKMNLSPFKVLLWSEYEDEREIENPESIANKQFDRSIEIHDERADYLIDLFNLENIKETIVLDVAWKLACRAFTNTRIQRFQKKDSEISLTNIVGRILTINFNRKPRLCVKLNFDINYKNSTAKSFLLVEEQFYYGHDGYESDTSFVVKSQDPIFDNLKTWRIGFGEDYLCWNAREKREKDSKDSTKPLLRSILRQLLSVAPHYHVLNKQVAATNPQNLISFFLCDIGEYDE